MGFPNPSNGGGGGNPPVGTDLTLGAVSAGQNPRLLVQGWNGVAGAVQSGYVKYVDAGNNPGNMTMGATTGNIRCQVDTYDGTGSQHIGLNIGGTPGSAITVKRNGGGHCFMTIRNSDAQTNGASPQSVDILMDATGNLSFTQTAGVTLFNRAIGCRNVAAGITQAIVMANADFLAARNAANSATIPLVGLDANNRVSVASGGADTVTGGNLGVAGMVDFGTGTKVMAIPNATAVPSTNPVGGGVLYVEAGALKYRGSGGTITVLGPA